MVTQFLSMCQLPSEIHRSVRGLDEVHFWKASEFRSFLYYLSVIILPHVLSVEAYQHFLTLFCAVTICSSNEYKSLLDLSQTMFLHFVNKFKYFYGDYVTSNVHNLIHVTDEVKRFGPLNTFSSYPFENKLYSIKKMLRDGNKPLAQIAKRLHENVQCVQTTTIQAKTETVYPKVLKVRRMLRLDYGQFVISQKGRDKYFMTFEGDIVEVKEIKETCILGYKIDNLTDIFDKPIKSSYLKMYRTTYPYNNRNIVAIKFSDVQFKFACTIYSGNIYCIPLIHTL